MYSALWPYSVNAVRAYGGTSAQSRGGEQEGARGWERGRAKGGGGWLDGWLLAGKVGQRMGSAWAAHGEAIEASVARAVACRPSSPSLTGEWLGDDRGAGRGEARRGAAAVRAREWEERARAEGGGSCCRAEGGGSCRRASRHTLLRPRAPRLPPASSSSLLPIHLSRRRATAWDHARRTPPTSAGGVRRSNREWPCAKASGRMEAGAVR